MLVFLVAFSITGCAATIPATNTSAGPERCPDLIAWPQVPAPLSCDDPGCQGASWAVPPYRCRQLEGTMFGDSVFGCRCCPRLIDCDDPKCSGSSTEEICQSELLKDCLCTSSNRRVSIPSPNVRLDGAVALPVEHRLTDLNIHEPSNDGTGIVLPTTSNINCPRAPPIRCLDPQCRGADDWKTEPLQCNREDGQLFIEGTQVSLNGCPCCPEYIQCSSADCNGNESQACTTGHLNGCFCDWPARGPVLSQWPSGDEPDIYMNTFDAAFDDPNFQPYGDQSLRPTVTAFTGGLSVSNQARPFATHTNTASTPQNNHTEMDCLLSRQEASRLSQNASLLMNLDHFKGM